MHQTALALLTALAACAVQATPIAYTAVGYTTSAFADVGGVSDGPNAAATPADPLPLASAATILTGGGLAAAAATAATFQLDTASQAASSGDPTLASAVATFFGEFTTPGGVLSLVVDYLTDPTAAGSTLAILWIVDGIILPTLGTGTFLSGNLAAGLAGTLEITLTSVVSADVAGAAAANQSSVAFVLNQVPEPAILALLLPGLGLLRWRRTGGRPAAA